MMSVVVYCCALIVLCRHHVYNVMMSSLLKTVSTRCTDQGAQRALGLRLLPQRIRASWAADGCAARLAGGQAQLPHPWHDEWSALAHLKRP